METDVIAATAAPIVEAVSADYSEIISRLDIIIEKLDKLLSVDMSIYSWLALFITLVLGGWCIWQILRPLTYFFR